MGARGLGTDEGRTDGDERAGALPGIRSLDGLVEMMAERRGLHIRYSHGPEHDRDNLSMDYESGLQLPGLSATVLEPEPWWTRPLQDWLARQIQKYAGLAAEDENRYAWILTGRMTARGPDHEPILTDTEPVARIEDTAVREARVRYRERFDVGRDST